MTEFRWIDAFSIGVDEIDDGHRDLMRIMGEVKTAAKDGDRQRCSALLLELIESAKAHFAVEEALLRDAGYPGLEEHIKYHEKLLLEAQAAKEICDQIKNAEDLERCGDVLGAFLVDDILRGDLHFKSFLEEKGIIKPPAD